MMLTSSGRLVVTIALTSGSFGQSVRAPQTWSARSGRQSLRSPAATRWSVGVLGSVVHRPADGFSAAELDGPCLQARVIQSIAGERYWASSWSVPGEVTAETYARVSDKFS